MERNQSYYEGALEMALIANKKAGIETQEESLFYIAGDKYVFRYPYGMKDGEIYYEREYLPILTPLKDVFDWIEECQNLVIHV